MKKCIIAVLLAVFAFGGVISAGASNLPESYMGFSVSKDWYTFSKNMTDTDLLESVDLSAEEVNKALTNSDCEYYIVNPEENAKIYVKVKKNDLSLELYNITEAEDEMILGNLDRILKDGFSMDGFWYDAANATVTEYPQMKFITIPGTVQYDGKTHGMIFGATFVNGNGIAFLMYLEEESVSEQNLSTFSELASSVSFTQIKEKSQVVLEEDAKKTEEKPGKLQYITGGFGALALVALILGLIARMRKPEKAGENETDTNLD